MIVYQPKEGHDFNPLRRHRNVACPCGSKFKAKYCHGMFDILPIETIRKIKEYLRLLSSKGVIQVKPSEICDPQREA